MTPDCLSRRGSAVRVRRFENRPLVALPVTQMQTGAITRKIKGSTAMRHPQLWMGLLLWSVFGQAQAAWTVNMAPGATEVSHAVFDLHMTIFWICVVIGIIVFGAMFWSMISRDFRYKPMVRPLDMI